MTTTSELPAIHDMTEQQVIEEIVLRMGGLPENGVTATPETTRLLGPTLLERLSKTRRLVLTPPAISYGMFQCHVVDGQSGFGYDRPTLWDAVARCFLRILRDPIP